MHSNALIEKIELRLIKTMIHSNISLIYLFQIFVFVYKVDYYELWPIDSGNYNYNYNYLTLKRNTYLHENIFKVDKTIHTFKTYNICDTFGRFL